MELRHLRTFIAVAEERQFRAAAARLHLSAPSVTEHVHALERDIGESLLVRGAHVALTPAGTELLARAHQIVADTDAARAAAASMRQDVHGELHVGVMSNGAGELTWAITRAFMVAHPAVHVRIHRLDFTDHVGALLHRRVHVAFLRPGPDDDRLRVTSLCPDSRVLVVPQRHPLAAATDGIAISDVLDLNFVGLASEALPSFARYLYLQSARNGEQPRRGRDGCRDVTDVLAAVAAGRGVASAASSFQGFADWPGVAYVPLRGAEPATNTLVCRYDDQQPLVLAFADCARQLAAVAARRAFNL